MHILILYQHYLRPGDPGHSRLNEYARTWTEKGHEVTVLTGQTSYMDGAKANDYKRRIWRKEKDGAVTVYRCFVPSRSNQNFVRRTLAYVSFALSSILVSFRLKRPDVLLVSSPPLTIGIAALAIRRMHRVPMVFEVRDLWPESAITTGILTNRHMIRLLTWLERRCYREAVALNVLTPAFRKNIVERGLAPAARIANIAAGVNLETMNASRASIALREELGWGNRTVVLYTGAIGKANRLEQLVEVAKLLVDRPDILIAIVGAGMEEEWLRRRVADLGLRNIVFFGPRPKSEMPPIIASADICTAVLMRNDTFKTVYPNKVFDYMACGRPVVVGIDGIIRELIEREQAGIFAEPENPAALRAAILALADDPERARACGARGRRYVEREFNRAQMAERYEELLLAAASGTVPSPGVETREPA